MKQGAIMTRPKAQPPNHPLGQQILALALAWLALAAGLPTNALSSPLSVVSHVRFASPLAAALPRAEAVPIDPAPLPAPDPPDDTEEAKKWGEITVGQPKIWQYERVNSLLDGLLRDVQGVSMSDLIGLDSNATNGAAVKFVQSMLEIGVQYNQGAAATNAITLQNYAASQGIASGQIQANSAYLQQLYSERTSVTGQLLAAMQLNTTLQGQLATTDPTTAAYKSLATQQQAAAAQVTSLQADLTSINSQITAASATTIPPAPTLTPTTGGTAPETANTFSSFLGNLPPALTTNIVNQLQSPSLPATKRLDNFITLLYERMAREISVLQDDVMRDTDNVPFLVQFDVGLYPSSQAKNHVAVVEFTMDCDGCKVYSIYPGQSSYNLANYEGTSKRYSLYGALQTLFGFGINADYRRQTDTLHGDLVQSVYMSGFQEGAASTARGGIEASEQRFGWYYGEAPFEQLVTPGIRTTFALISVPRSILESCLVPSLSKSKTFVKCPDKGLFHTDDTNRKIAIRVTAGAHWVRRDDPYYQKAHWYESKNYVATKCPPSACRDIDVVLPGTDGINDIPDVVLAERNRLHVLGMEYNPIYYAPPPQPTTGAPTTTTSPLAIPGTASATASGAGTGTTTVTVSGAGTASASSSGTTSTTATATAANPSTTPSTTPSTPSTADPLTGCKQDQCAAVLVKLAEPIDPNMVVTVRGLPLRRVRDWRGRATSVLPPAQSASDLTSPATLSTPGSTAAPAKPLGAENAPSASLFEADSPGPDTWMEVDSHRILLNISRTLAGGNNEFPTIQIVDPGRRALFVPNELDTGFSELIMNGFHFPTRDGDQLRKYLCNHLQVYVGCPGSLPPAAVPAPNPANVRSDRPSAHETLLIATRLRGATLASSGDPSTSDSVKKPGSDLHQAGPYAAETFLPLFLPRRDPQPIYAYLGETGVQILVGLGKLPPDSTKTGPPPKPKKWLAGNTQIVLEDRYLDLAWSLTCYPQSPMLVCDVPMREIRDAYTIVKKICVDGNACPSMPSTLDESLSISSLQVWVDQYDPDSDDSFYSPVPAIIGRFPVQSASGVVQADVGYRPWYFESASPNWVKLTGCNYPEFPAGLNHKSQLITILGRGIPQPYGTQVLQPGAEAGCKWFVIPTLALTYQEVVVEYPSAKDNSTDLIPFTEPPVTSLTPAPCTNHAVPVACAPESLSTALFQPSFNDPIAIPHSITTGNTSTIDQWTIDIPGGRLDCADTLNQGFPNAIWKFGATTVPLRKLSDAAPLNCETWLARVAQVARQAAVAARKNADDAQEELDTANAEAHAAKKKADTARPAAEAAKKESDAAKAAAEAAAKKVADPAKPADAAAKKVALDAKAASDDAAKKETATAKPATDAATAEKKAEDAASNFNKLEALAKVAEQRAVSAENARGEVATWNVASKTGQIVLELVVNRADLDKLPMKNPAQVLRGPLLSKIAALPDLRPSFLPTRLTVVSTGTNTFALQGDNAGVIDAVNVQGPDGVINTIPTVSGGQTAFVTIPGSKASTKPDTRAKPPVIDNIASNSVPGGTLVEITGNGFGTTQGSVSFGKASAFVDTNCWSPTSIIVDVPLNALPGQVNVSVATKPPAPQTSKPFAFTVAEKHLERVEPTNCPAHNASNNDPADSGPKAGAYSIVPLIALSKDSGGKWVYMPLDVLDPNGKPLAFTVAESKNAGATTPKGVDSPTTTLTISKKTTVTPAATTTNSGSGQ
jgi:IPT/TIG domain